MAPVRKDSEVVRWALRRGALSLACLLFTGCADPESVPDQEGLVDVKSAIINASSSSAAETAVTTPDRNSLGDVTFVITANTYNDPLITFNNNSRQLFSGASLMFFTRMSPDDNGGSADGGGRLRPPSGWSVLWGDPSVVRNRANATRIYLANLAIPSSKFPASGVIDGPVNPSGLPANFCGAYIGGACIARSSDGGSTFSLSENDCLQRKTTSCPNGTFYDGSALETSPEGRVYAAFNDTFRFANDVYMATSQTGSFQKITDPPGAGSTILHPRLKSGPGGMYLLQVTSTSGLTISRYPAGTNPMAAWTTPVAVAPGLPVTEADLVMSDRTIRIGPEYNLDIGTNENGATEVRVAFTVLDQGSHHHIHVAKCSTGSPIACSQPAIWNTDTFAGDQWDPAITTGTNLSGHPFWSISFYNTSNFVGGNQVELWRGNLPNSSSFSTVRQETAELACPDLRGYWGDYDYSSNGFNGFAYRGMSISSSTGCTRTQYQSTVFSGYSYWDEL